MTRILHVVGCKHAGKTRTCEVLIPPLRRLGLSVGTLKYTEHDGFDWDVEGKDTFRHRQAGSDITGIFGRHCYAFSDNRAQAQGISIAQMIRTFYSGLDLVLIEGYRMDEARKIEVLRPGYTDHAVANPSQLVATYGERLFEYQAPHFAYGAENQLALHILTHLTELTSFDDHQPQAE
ncbi:MAG: molybdopterin-guanine dinucleotide biosynthesis protein B [Candidatus Zixiibacteriota bacterium]